MRIFVHNRRLWPGFSSWKASRTRRKPLNDLGWYIYITFSFSFNGTIKTRETMVMKGYFTNAGYWGWVGDKFLLFSSESDSLDYMED